jgi:hypothetical protein
VALTDTAIKNLKPKDKPYSKSDSNGLIIDVRPTGTKVFRYRFRFNNKPAIYTIGEYPLIGLADARAKRDEARKLLVNGIDPRDAKHEAKEAAIQAAAKVEAEKLAAQLTFTKLFHQWYETRLNDWTESHAEKVLQRANNHLLPYIGKMPVKDITTPTIITVLEKLDEAEKTHMRGKVKGIASMAFKFGIGYGLSDNDPTSSLPDNIFKAHETARIILSESRLKVLFYPT